LLAENWTASSNSDGDSIYTYYYANSSITCGTDGTVPPIITYTSNLDEYGKISKATATSGLGIVFEISEKPENDIGIIIIDVK
jgi:hypothetical protein